MRNESKKKKFVSDLFSANTFITNDTLVPVT